MVARSEELQDLEKSKNAGKKYCLLTNADKAKVTKWLRLNCARLLAKYILEFMSTQAIKTQIFSKTIFQNW